MCFPLILRAFNKFSRQKCYRLLLLFGMVAFSIGYLLLGPAPFLPFLPAEYVPTVTCMYLLAVTNVYPLAGFGEFAKSIFIIEANNCSCMTRKEKLCLERNKTHNSSSQAGYI